MAVLKIILFSCLVTFSDESFTQQLDSKSLVNYDIVLSDSSNRIQQIAASELAHYLEYYTSEPIPVVNKYGLEKKHHFLLGTQFIQDSINPDFGTDKNAIAYCIYNHNIYLAGYDDKVGDLKIAFYSSGEYHFGTLFSIYNFLAEELGFEWFFPGKKGEYFPEEMKKLRIEDKSLQIKIPAVPERTVLWKTLSYNKDTVMYWLLRNKLTTTPKYDYSHSWYKFLPSQKYFNSNPELFAKIGFSREKYSKGATYHGNSAQLCTSNKNTIHLFIERIKDSLQNNPNLSTISLSPNDGHSFCTCYSCKVLNSNSITDKYADYSENSGTIFQFYSDVSLAVEKLFPEIKIGGLAYKSYSYPPPKLNIDSNFQIRLAINNYGFFSEESVELNTVCDLIIAWHKIHPNMAFNSFPYGGFWVFPMINTNTHQRVIKCLVDNKYRAVNYIFLPEWSSQGLDLWLISKWLWNPNLNKDTLLSIYYRNVFPNAHKVMKYFNNAIQKNIETCNCPIQDFTFQANMVKKIYNQIYTPQLLEDTKRDLEKIIDLGHLDGREKDNIMNQLLILDFLKLQSDAFSMSGNNSKLLKIQISKFITITTKLHERKVITKKSPYFNVKKSPSIFIHER